MNTKRLFLFALLSAVAVNLTSASLTQVSSEGFLADDAVEINGNVLSQLEENAVAESDDLSILAENINPEYGCDTTLCFHSLSPCCRRYKLDFHCKIHHWEGPKCHKRAKRLAAKKARAEKRAGKEKAEEPEEAEEAEDPKA